MKKLLIFLSAVLLTMPFAAAGDTGFKFGMVGSPNISWHRPETRGFERNGVTFGLSYGLVADYVFAEGYAISSGINLLHTGGKLKYRYIRDGLDTDKRRDYSLRYLQVPVTIKLRTDEIGYITYYGQFGLGVGFNTKAQADERIPQPDGTVVSARDVDISDEITFMRASLIIGAGVEYSLGGRTSLMGGLVFNNGFTNALKMDSPVPGGAPPSSMVNYLEVTLGVMF